MRFVKDVMTAYPDVLAPDDAIHHAARMMRDRDYGAMPVVDSQGVADSGVLVGIVTDRDIVIKAVAEGKDSRTPVRECMSLDPQSVAPDTRLEDALHVMRTRQIRRLAVVDFGRLLGMVSFSDLTGGETTVDEEAALLKAVSTNEAVHPAATLPE